MPKVWMSRISLVLRQSLPPLVTDRPNAKKCLLRTTTCENTSNTDCVLLIFLKTLNSLLKELLMNSKTRWFVKFLLRFVKFHECFATYSRKLSSLYFLVKITFPALIFKSLIFILSLWTAFYDFLFYSFSTYAFLIMYLYLRLFCPVLFKFLIHCVTSAWVYL